MKNALLLTGLWVAIIAAAFMIVYWDSLTGAWLPITTLQEVEVPVVYGAPEEGLDIADLLEWRVIAMDQWVHLSHAVKHCSLWTIAVTETDLCRAFTLDGWRQTGNHFLAL